MTSVSEIGKAYLAYSTFNYNAKKDRITAFDLPRWLKVIRAISGEDKGKIARTAREWATKELPSKKKRKWSAKQRQKYQRTVKERINGTEALRH